ncbi:MAG: hypothetical protein LC677_15295 [Halomonas sp.]|nr:hypothetical protein [Halomonas sp.]
MRRELVALREEVAQLRALPPPETTKEAVETTKAPKADDDPHGLRALAKALYSSDEE